MADDVSQAENESLSVSWNDVTRFIRQLSHDLRNNLNAIELQSAYIAELATSEDLKTDIKSLREMVASLALSLQKLAKSVGEVSPNPIPYRALDLVQDLRSKIQRDLAQAANSQLANISTRGFVDIGDNVMIGGFILSGGTSGGKVVVRALGPSVPVSGALGDPTLELHNGSGTTIATNDNWKTRPDGSSQQAEIEATTIPPTNDLESALVQTLVPGNYTAIVRGKNNGTGLALVEVYNLQ